MAASFTKVATFTGDPAEETDGVEVTLDEQQPTNDYLIFATVETEGGAVTVRIPKSQKTIAGFVVYPTAAFVGDVNLLIVPQS